MIASHPYCWYTFNYNAADDKCYLQSAKLTVGNEIYYPEIEYSYDNIVRIFKAVTVTFINKMIKIQDHY